MIDVPCAFESSVFVELQYYVVTIWIESYLWGVARFDNEKGELFLVLNVLVGCPPNVARPTVVVQRIWNQCKA